MFANAPKLIRNRRASPQWLWIDEATSIILHLSIGTINCWWYPSSSSEHLLRTVSRVWLKGKGKLFVRSARESISTGIICTNKNYVDKNYVESEEKRSERGPERRHENDLHTRCFLRECGWQSNINTRAHMRDVTVRRFFSLCATWIFSWCLFIWMSE